MSEFDIPISTASFSSHSTSDYSSSSSNDSNSHLQPEKKRKIIINSNNNKLPKSHNSDSINTSNTNNHNTMSHFHKQRKSKQNVILQYSIDPYEFADEYLIELSIEIFAYYQLFQHYSFTEENLIAFLYAVKDLYQPQNNFHNFKHAWGVMHMSFQLLVRGVDRCLSTLNIFAVLIAAVCHDVGHPGNNNAFEFATQSDVSKKYSKPNENCVLERYHCGLTRSLLISDKEKEVEGGGDHHHLLDVLTEEEQEKFLEHLNFIILGTDMAKHGALVEETQQLVRKAKTLLLSTHSSIDNDTSSSESKKLADSSSSEGGGVIISGRSDLQLTPKANRKHGSFAHDSDSNSPPGSPTAISSNMSDSAKDGSMEQLFTSEESRRALTRILVHTADIGAQTQENSIAYKWVNRCYTEFQTQANREKQLGIMTSPFLHELTDDKKIFASQYSFINDIVEPIWKAFTELFPELEFASGQLITNKTSYQKFF